MKGAEMLHGKGLRRRFVLGCCVLFVLCLLAVSGWAEGDESVTVTGKVEEIDSIKFLITVSYADILSGELREIDIRVLDNTKIMNGPEEITFLDIEQFDPVTVSYDGDGAGGFKAQEILDLNRPNK